LEESSKASPTYPQSELTFILDDYGKKGGITPPLISRTSFAKGISGPVRFDELLSVSLFIRVACRRINCGFSTIESIEDIRG
jgi:hypothetical protein